MYGQFGNFGTANAGLNNLSDDAVQRRSAVQMFEKLNNTARRSRWFGSITGHVHQLCRLADAVRSAQPHYEGVQIVPLAKIVGTENRSDEFDAHFRPVEDHIENRWVSLAAAYLRGVSLPPIELLRVGEDYYVRDGHHRVSVYRAYNQSMVEAIVTAME